MTTGTLLCEVSDGVLWLRLNRPRKLNAMDADMRRGLLEALATTGQSPDVRAVVIGGTPPAFSAGVDVSELGDGLLGTVQMLDLGRDIITTIANLPKPVIAAVRGTAAGAGLSLVLACDLVVAAASASFRPIFADRGLAPDWGCAHLLVQHAGLLRAKNILFAGQPLDMRTAQEYGLVTRLCEDDDFEDELAGFAARLAAGPTAALGVTKRLLNHAASGADLAATLALETYGQAFATASADHAEAVRAFTERRAPSFGGR
ncbi:enoyl-CoA hydratase-related protein [Saccharomonospora sp. NPDC046836]|uniref:enoyl-CoA hydratase-related protein n=1 Tax=Saccharomonospora sp. NPDC046836 TaxID=3156921 RepID=UPI0033F386BE